MSGTGEVKLTAAEINSRALDRLPCVDLDVENILVYTAKLDELTDPRFDTETLLSAEERQRAACYHQPIDRMRFIRRRGLLRLLLARALVRRPDEIQLKRTPEGRPQALEAAGRLDFSMSQSGGLAAIALSGGRRVGIDIEQRDGGLECLALARRFFTPAEVKFIEGYPGEEQADAFLRCWTRKEAYIKAVGPRGLEAIETTAEEIVIAGGQCCRFMDLDLPGGYQGAVAYCCTLRD